MSYSVLIFGLGYTGAYFAKACVAQGFSVVGTRRRLDDDTQGMAPPFVYPFDGCKKLDPQLFEEAEIILSTIPPESDGRDPVLSIHASDLKKLKKLKWLGYLSATSVYGDTNGHVVSESSALKPRTAMGKARLLAEEQWRTLYDETKLPLHIFRLSGIYGRGHSIFDRLLVPGFQNYYEETHLFSRIHVYDIIQTLMQSIKHPCPGSIYNVTDDVPAPFHEVAEYAAKLMGCNLPKRIPLTEAQLSPAMHAFFSENRLVSNERIKKNLGIHLKYPSFREGLQAIFKELMDPS
ncbi:MAG: SDR family NAD(P)-dependent oxidoreductase [Candidatus Nucleicultricaceae bacterium]